VSITPSTVDDTSLPPYGAPSSLPSGLDWVAFTEAYFPRRRQDDLEATLAYAAYRRYHEVAPIVERLHSV
jgi:hypothetical protein